MSCVLVVVLVCFVWLFFVCVACVCLFKCVCVVGCDLSRDVVMCCMFCVWLLSNVIVWLVCGFVCVVV